MCYLDHLEVMRTFFFITFSIENMLSFHVFWRADLRLDHGPCAMLWRLWIWRYSVKVGFVIFPRWALKLVADEPPFLLRRPLISAEVLPSSWAFWVLLHAPEIQSSDRALSSVYTQRRLSLSCLSLPGICPHVVAATLSYCFFESVRLGFLFDFWFGLPSVDPRGPFALHSSAMHSRTYVSPPAVSSASCVDRGLLRAVQLYSYLHKNLTLRWSPCWPEL